jgi:hypothetical protein
LKTAEDVQNKRGEKMASKRRLQVFVSSTYTDLKEERQAAVAAILKAGHIPAGMELFTAGDEAQMSIIKRWIDESDVYMLILGGRYGSIEKSSGLSYTELEFEYAIEQSKPFFAVIENQAALEAKVKLHGSGVLELENPEKLKLFRARALQNMSAFFDDTKDIKLSVHESLSDFANNRELRGWIAATDVQDTSPLFDQIERLSQENSALREKVSALERTTAPQNNKAAEFAELMEILTHTQLEVPGDISEGGEAYKLDLFSIFWSMHERFVTGISTEVGMSKLDQFLFYTAGPKLVLHGLVDMEKVAGAKFRRMSTTRQGQAFLAQYEKSRVEKSKAKRLLSDVSGAASTSDEKVEVAAPPAPRKRAARKRTS